MITEDDIRAIRAVVKDEMDKMRMKVSEFSGRGSHTVISSLGDIVLQPGNGCRAIYKNAEIGSGSGSGTIDGSGTAGYIPKLTDTDTIGNSLLSESGTVISSAATINMTVGKSIQIYDVDSHLDGYLIGLISNDQELPNAIGVELLGKQHSGATVGAFFAGNSNGYTGNYIVGISGSEQAGIAITEKGIGITPVAGLDVKVYTSAGGKFYYNGTEVGGGAPSDATYIVQTANGSLSAEQALGALATGILKNTTTTGVLSIADAADIPDLSSLYLSLASGGTVAGNVLLAKSNPLLTIKASDASSPVLDFRDSSNNVDAQLYTTTGNDTVLVSTYGGLYLATALTTGGSIFLETKDVTRLTIADALITSDVPITMSTTNAINFSDTNTKIVRSGSNLDIHAGGAWKLAVTSTYVDFSVAITPSVTDSKDIGTSSYYWNNAYIKTLYIDDGATKIDNNAGSMRFTVATGKVFEFVVS